MSDLTDFLIVKNLTFSENCMKQESIAVGSVPPASVRSYQMSAPGVEPYNEVQYIMGNGHMGPPHSPCGQTDTTETLPSRNFVGRQ